MRKNTLLRIIRKGIRHPSVLANEGINQIQVGPIRTPIWTAAKTEIQGARGAGAAGAVWRTWWKEAARPYIRSVSTGRGGGAYGAETDTSPLRIRTRRMQIRIRNQTQVRRKMIDPKIHFTSHTTPSISNGKSF